MYSPDSGNLQYYTNGVIVTNYFIGVMPQTDKATLQLNFTAWGWYTGHQQLFKNLLVTQVTSGGSSSITSTISTLNSPTFGGTATGGGTFTNGTYQILGRLRL